MTVAEERTVPVTLTQERVKVVVCVMAGVVKTPPEYPDELYSVPEILLPVQVST